MKASAEPSTPSFCAGRFFPWRREEGSADRPPDPEEGGGGDGDTPKATAERKGVLRRLSVLPAAAAKGRLAASPFRFSSRRVRKRVVFKNGDCNVVQGNVAKRRRRYLQDIFTTLVDVKWRWTLLVFALNFLLSWLGFAVIWWVIAVSHGDIEVSSQPRIPDEGNEAVTDALLDYGSGSGSGPLPTPSEISRPPERTPCVREIHGFASCFLFSVETQHTIGYGSRSTTEECPEAIFVMCLQSITGVMIQAFMVGIVFAKLSRPKKRTQTLLFSKHAVVCLRDGRLCLMFRVGDMRKSHIIEAHVRAQLIRRRITREGEVLPFFQQELKVGAGDGEEDRILFIWPTTIVHPINCSSPLYSLSAAELMKEQFEIVVVLEGVIESTGMTTQARSSYLPSEVLWGHRFRPLVSFKKDSGEYEVNYGIFNETYEVETPLCSARTLDELRIDIRRPGETAGNGTAGANESTSEADRQNGEEPRPRTASVAFRTPESVI